MYIPHLLCLFICQRTFRLPHVFVIVSIAAVSMGVHASFQITILSGCMPRSGIAVSYVSSVFVF